jgi:1,4-dihydroxy-2-naphthoate octaprenyltransferase
VGPTVAARLIAFVKLGRPQFLVGGFVLYGLGAALAAVGGAVLDWRRYAWGQLVITVTQLMTHYANDYFDLEADKANATPTRWSGGSRVLPDGGLPPVAALAAALALGACALAAALWLGAGARGLPLVLPLALVMLALAWSYSAPPLRLHSRGLGELTTALVVTLLTPLLGFYLQAAALRTELFLATLPVSGLQFAMLLAIEFPDAAGDALGGKRTLVVRRGADWAARLYVAVVLGSFAVLPVLVAACLPARVAAAAALVAPLGIVQAVRAARGGFRDPARWESLAFWSVAQLIATAAAELVGALATLGQPVAHSP